TKPVFFVGGDKRDRTADLSGGKRRKARRRRVLIERQEVSGCTYPIRSNEKRQAQSLSFSLVEISGIEPLTS
ncbi:MAG: hypothetical protein Q4E38_08215, partial [Eubacteriales bacterium]|nr:hypothetical protein [Eubacteriales bacterium]